jgi:hypothetical protein
MEHPKFARDPTALAKRRVDPPRNHQRRRIRYAADYEIARVSVVAA